MGRMVEGHSVRRIVHALNRQLAGKKYTASSPNGRFATEARALAACVLTRFDSIGKNLFVFFHSDADPDPYVVPVHFGMSGRWGVFKEVDAPAPTSSTRLRLDGHGFVSHV